MPQTKWSKAGAGIQFVKRETINQTDAPESEISASQIDNDYTQDVPEESSQNTQSQTGVDTPADGQPKPLMSLVPPQKTNEENILGLLHKGQAKPFHSLEDHKRFLSMEKDPFLIKLRKLTVEVLTLKSYRPNAVDKMMSACNRVPVTILFKATHCKITQTHRGVVEIDGVEIGAGDSAARLKDSKIKAFEVALQKIFLPHLRVIQVDPVLKRLQSSRNEFTSEPPAPAKVPLSQRRDEAASLKLGAAAKKHKNPKSKYFNGYEMESNSGSIPPNQQGKERFLKDFVIVEPQIPYPDCTPAHTMRRSADFNNMYLEMEFTAKGPSLVRCALSLERILLADVCAETKSLARDLASEQALAILRRLCWIIKTKQAYDSDSLLCKDELFNELDEAPGVIKSNNVGHKMLQKMGWSGGGVGKDGTGIANPVELTSVLNRQGLGLSAAKGIKEDFRTKMHDKIAEYAASNRQDDLVFSKEFKNDERQIIHQICRKFNLKSKSRGKGNDRYLCASRKRSVNELFNHIMNSGGETIRYVLCPPGSDGNPGDLSDEALGILESLRQEDDIVDQAWGPPEDDVGPYPTASGHQNYDYTQQEFSHQQRFGNKKRHRGGHFHQNHGRFQNDRYPEHDGDEHFQNYQDNSLLNNGNFQNNPHHKRSLHGNNRDYYRQNQGFQDDFRQNRGFQDDFRQNRGFQEDFRQNQGFQEDFRQNQGFQDDYRQIQGFQEEFGNDFSEVWPGEDRMGRIRLGQFDPYQVDRYSSNIGRPQGLDSYQGQRRGRGFMPNQSNRSREMFNCGEPWSKRGRF